MADPKNAEIIVYVGTYTGDASEGVYAFNLDPSSGTLAFASKTHIFNPFFLTIDPGQRTLYATSCVEEFGGQSGGTVASFGIDPDSGDLTFLNQQSARGTLPCYLSIDKTGKYLLTANYLSGSVAVLTIEEDGRLGPATDFIQHAGSSVHPERQEGPHVHSIVLDPGGRHAYAADLGIDKILIYRFDSTQGKLTPGVQPWVKLRAGAGPRHFAFHPNGRYAYVINELDNTFTVFAYDAAQGALAEVQTVSTLPDDFAGTSYCADVKIYPTGKFLYGSNRGHDSIVRFAIDEATGQLTFGALEPTRGKFPYNLAIDPTNTFLLATNFDSDNVVVFRIDPQTGELAFRGQVQVPKPACVRATVWPY